MKIRIRQSYELLDKVNTKINRYKQRPIFDLIDFYHTRSEDGYIYLHVVVQGERDGAPINVYQILGAIVTLEKINDLLYRYVDPEDEMYTSRTFEVEVIIGGVESKKKQTTVISSPTTYYLTSQIYPINFTDESNLSSSSITGRILTTNDLRLYQSIFEEGKLGISKLNGIFKQSLFVYLYKDDSINGQQKPNYESVELKLHKINGILRQLLIQNSPKPENVKTVINKITGTLRQLLINYTYWAPEILKANVNKIEGSFTYFPTYFESYISGNTSVYDPNDSDNGVTIIQKSITSGNKNDVNDKGIAYKSHNTSVLDFENGLTDRVNPGSVTWTKVGTGDLTTVNKLYSANSFETKALGDSLYTSSNIITGGSTPFTIEFYALIKSLEDTSLSSYINIVTGDHIDFTTNGQGLYIHRDNKTLVYYRYMPDNLDVHSKLKISFNEINKITMSYDGACIRIFINDYLSNIIGTLSGFIKRDFIAFYKTISNTAKGQILGIIDNINIHDGIATKVRDYDPNEEFLIVDLAFDGENNSTKIVDNGTEKLNWSGGVLKTSQKLTGFSSLSLYNDYCNTTNFTTLGEEDFTINFEYLSGVFAGQYGLLKIGDKGSIGSLSIEGVAGQTRLYVYYEGSYLFSLNNSHMLYNSQWNKICIVRESNIYKLYINNTLFEINSNVEAYNFNNNNIVIGTSIANTIYFNSFKIYKGVAVIPESPVGKIQLDFDNNLIDKYNNSTWTNNGVTFDQVNSIKGHAAYFNNSSNVYSSSNSSLNFEDKNFKITFDFKSLDVSIGASVLLGTGHTSIPSSGILNICYGTMQGYYFSNQNGNTLSSSNIVVNQYYKSELNRKNNVVSLYLNDVIVGSLNCNGEIFDYSNNGTRIGYGAWDNNAFHNGYIDNFKSIKDYNGDIVIDKPAVHLPLETNAINIGFTPFTVNSVGNPTYHVVDGKKCIKFEFDKYLTINSNNIFNFSTNSDFYIEFDFYLISHKSYSFLLCNNTTWDSSALFDIYLDVTGSLYMRRGSNNFFTSSYAISVQKHHKFILCRNKNDLVLQIDDDISVLPNQYLNLSQSIFILGSSGWTSNDYFNGYMSNFKMFVGTSEIPETYSDKAVLDLDFKPTRKSYLFKDNNNKCVIHPVNITQRDYQDSQYCCSFNGTNQYLQLGKNDLLNFGNDDFIIYMKFKLNVLNSSWSMLLCDAVSSTNWIDIAGDGALCVKVGGVRRDSATQIIQPNVLYDMVLSASNSVMTLNLNGVIIPLSGSNTNIVSNVNFNLGNNTTIGRYEYGGNEYFNGYIYKVKVYRNTTDTSVLNLPILNTPSTIYLPLIKDSIDIRTGATWTNNANRVTYENDSAKFDGNTSTYLSTGVTSNFNYATNDFTVGFDTYKSGNQSEARILSSMANNPSIYPRTEIKQSQGMGLTLSNYTNSSEVMYKTYKTGDVLNNWNKSRFIKTNNTLYTYINDSLVDMVTVPNGTQFNLNTNNGTRISGVGHTTSSSYFYQGYIKNVYSNNIATTSDVLPYLYMPYDTSLTDFGVNNLSITNSTTSASVLDTLNGVKCTRITTVSTNPYITMTLGSVFTIKAKIYIPTKASSGYHKPLFGTGYNSNIGFLLSQFTEPWSGNANPQLSLRTSGSNISFAINGLIGTWIDIIVTKTLTTLTLNVNGVDVGSMNNSNWNNSDFESSRTFYIGDAGTDWKESSTFYIKDFRFYKGLPSIPTNEVLSKKVLDLKFKKDDARVYPFKDESRRHIVSYNAMSKYNLVNIEETDCIQFNGVDQYLELGNTKLMNFGNEDFVIAFKIYIIPYLHTGSSQWQVILASGGTSPSSNVNYIAYDQTTKSLVIRATDNEVYRISNVLNEYAWNTVIITRTADKFNTIINNNINNGVISSTANFNLNYNANTYIGIDKWNTSNEYLKGYLADLRIVKGSNDISLLDLNTTETITIVNPPKTIYYPAVMNELDAFNISWYQTNSSNLVRLKEFNKGENTALYFDGISGLISSNYCYSIGLNKFTFECSILISGAINASYPVKIFMSHINVNYYIDTFRYWLEVTSTGILRFTTNNGNSYYSTPANTIGYDQKYHIEVSRDENKILRVFVNGVSLVEGICNDNIGSQTYDNITYQSYLSLILGKNADYYTNTVNYGNLIGMIENFYFIKGICKHTSNFTPSVPSITLNPNKTLLNVNSSLGTNPSTIIDVGNNITYTNAGCTVEATPSNSSNIRNYSLRSQSTATRIVSSVSASTFNLTNENWTIDLVFIPSQTNAEAYLLDTRINSTISRGIVVRQPETSPSSIRVEIGSTTASSYEISCTSANNSLVIGTRYHLKIVKCRERILIYLNGSEIGSYNWGIKEIGYTERVILFNNDLFNKGFNGYLLQFRYIKKIATDTRSYTDITEELK